MCRQKLQTTDSTTTTSTSTTSGTKSISPSEISLTSLVNKIIAYTPSNLINFVPPEQLEEELEDLLNLRNSTNAGLELSETIQLVLERCVNTSHPMFVSQMYGGVNPIGLLGAYIVEKMNTNQHTYEAAPVFVLTEAIILRQLRQLFYGTEEGDGVFAPGGSFANMYGLMIARNEMYPEIKNVGLSGLPPLVIFTSEEAHYSASKMGNWMGIGLDNIIKIKTTKNGSMIPSDLETAVETCRTQRKRPFAVMATAGTTVLGAFDPLDELAKICKRESMWLHCDAAWGGAFIFSQKLKNKWLQGIEKCDSIAWNAHKMLGAPLQCSVFLTKYSNVLAKCNSVPAPYLFQTVEKHYSTSYDVSGGKSVQCGRKADAFKLWLMWSAMGKDGFCETIENTESCAAYFTEQIKSRDGFLLYLDTHQCTNVFFWYVPAELRNCEKTEEWWEKIAHITRKIKTHLLLNNEIMIGYAPLTHKNVPDAFRLVLTSYPAKTFKDMDFIIQKIENIGSSLMLEE